jgi:integrase
MKVDESVSIFRRGRVWYAQYQQDGKQYRPSLRTKIKKMAIKKAGDLSRQLLAGTTPRKNVRVPISQVVEEFFTVNRGISTQSHYRTAANLFATFAAERKVTLISQIDIPLVDDFKTALLDGKLTRKKVGPKTVSFKLAVVRAIVLFAVLRRYLESNPLLGFKIKKFKAKTQPYWKWPEVLKILAQAGSEYFPLFVTLAYTGMRIGEALHLEWSDLDFDNKMIHIRCKTGWKPKSGENRIVPMLPQVAKALAPLMRSQPWVFARAETVLHRRPCVATVAALKALKALREILTQLKLTGRLHTFRHSFISHVLTKGTPEAIVRSWVGHVDPAIIRDYTHVANEISTAHLNQLFDDRSDTVPD